MALDTRKVRRKMLLNALSAPATAIPLLVGLTACVGSWATSMRPDLGILAGLAGVLGSAGFFLTQLFMHGDETARQAIDEVEAEDSAGREQVLDALDVRLRTDNDPRTETALRDLRSLNRAFDEAAASPAGDLAAAKAAGIDSGVRELFEQCVKSLERSMALWDTAQKLKTQTAREPILNQREEIILEVLQSIRQLGRILAAMQNLGAENGDPPQLTRLSKELDQRLAVARQVERRVKDFEDHLDTSQHE